MSRIIRVLYIVFSLILLVYVALPNFSFPKPPPDSVQSKEPADTENSLRRAYFTNFTRSEVLSWYKEQFSRSVLFNIPMPTFLLNYPPEESQTIIRDQTKSTFLQEIVNPFRETVFINGYEPKPDDDENRIIIDGVRWRQKIIVKFIPTHTVLRLVITLLTLLSVPVLASAFKPEFEFLAQIKNLLLKKIERRRRITKHGKN